ncbi:MAG: alpha/beta fold hydrolase, partial [Rubrivivax sp.]
MPRRMALAAGPLPPPGTLPDPYPFETAKPVHEGFVERGGVRSWYAQYGASGPWLAFAPIYAIANTHLLRGVVPWLAQHFRVVVMDLRGNGRSARPTSPAEYTFDHYFADFVAVLDRLEVDRTAVVGISATAMTAIRLAGEQPQRVSHLITAAGWLSMKFEDPLVLQQAELAAAKMRNDWAGHLDGFFANVFSEPHSTKPYEDAVLRNGGATDGATNAMGRAGWLGTDM